MKTRSERRLDTFIVLTRCLSSSRYLVCLKDSKSRCLRLRKCLRLPRRGKILSNLAAKHELKSSLGISSQPKSTIAIMNEKHKTFISYHHANDEYYKTEFKRLFSDLHDVIIPWDVEIGDIDPNLKTDTIRRKIRDEYLRDSTVTVVLIGTQSWQRKHIDWEIASSIRDTQSNSRSGLFGIFLPTYPLPENKYNPYTIPPRLYKNVECGFAKLHKWSNNPYELQNWIHEAFERRVKITPDNSYPLFVNNRNTNQWQ